jgi:1-hydroxycarotenoid 3,4-desaturase
LSETIVIGAGIGGICAAIELATAGRAVSVIEKEAAPGGKMRHVRAGSASIDGGPTVLTMKWVFDRLLEKSGTSLDRLVSLRRANVLARHHWKDGASLDLYAGIGDTSRAIERFSDRRNAIGYVEFCRDSAAIFSTLKESFIAAQRPGPLALASRIGWSRPGAMFALKPFSTMWPALGRYFTDPRLQQLFGRYATYCGSSPFHAPATLMLVAHVEQDGVWIAREGMHGVALALERHARSLGVRFRYGAAVQSIGVEGGRANSVTLAGGEKLRAGAIIHNGDVSALAAMLGGHGGKAPAPTAPSRRSLSAMTWCMHARLRGSNAARGLAHHTVFFSRDYPAEFARLDSGRVPLADPTIYVCAQDRTDAGERLPANGDDRERLFVLVNAPANGDSRAEDDREVRQCMEAVTHRLARHGLEIGTSSMESRHTGPQEFHRLFPATGGALYGPASHGWTASFRRAGARTGIAGLYLAGGSVHPGPGVPMAAMSGLLAAERAMAETPQGSFVSMARSRQADIAGGMSTG